MGGQRIARNLAWLQPVGSLFGMLNVADAHAIRADAGAANARTAGAGLTGVGACRCIRDQSDGQQADNDSRCSGCNDPTRHYATPVNPCARSRIA